MAVNQTINFKDPLLITEWLDTALKKEKEKHEQCLVMPDRAPGHVEAQGWGYVVAGYFLVEQSFKALLYVRGKKVSKTHSLSTLFDSFEENDKAVLREYYNDYQATIGGRIGRFSIKALDKFLVNLDGDENERGDHTGSFDWRYFLIEEKQNQKMPLVSVDYLHEIVFGCIKIIESAENDTFDPSRCTHSWRLQNVRQKKYMCWFDARRNSDGWVNLSDRLEILWGPDYRGRHDLCCFKGKETKYYFSDVPPENFDLPVFDKRREFETFDAEE